MIRNNEPVLIDFDLAYDSLQTKTSHPWHQYLLYPNEYQCGEFRGSPRYASINAHLGLTPSPSWDYESLFYTLASLHTVLPWSSVSDPDRFVKKIEYIMESKKKIPGIYHLVVDSQRQKPEYFMQLFFQLLEIYNPSEFGNLPLPQIKQTYKLHLDQPKNDSTRSLSSSPHYTKQQSKKNITAQAIEVEMRNVVCKILKVSEINDLDLACKQRNLFLSFTVLIFSVLFQIQIT